jgi:hypothetical protein
VKLSDRIYEKQFQTFCEFAKAPMLKISQNIWSCITFRAQSGSRLG